MHSHNNTLIAKLGFSDPDRSNPIHDAACRYLWQESQAVKVTKVALGAPLAASGFSRHLEVPISKGTGQYKTTIGFIDLQLAITEGGSRFVDVEVKATEIPVLTALRQINLYREYQQGTHFWVLATCWHLRPDERELLVHENIKPVHLGELFQQWHEKQTLFGSVVGGKSS